MGRAALVWEMYRKREREQKQKGSCHFVFHPQPEIPLHPLFFFELSELNTDQMTYRNQFRSIIKRWI